MGAHVFTDGSALRPKTPESAAVVLVSRGFFRVVACSVRWEEELAFCMAENNQWQEPNSSQQLKPSSCAGKLPGKSASGPIVCLRSTVSPEGDGGNTCPTLTVGKSSGRPTTPSASLSCSTRSGEATPPRQRSPQGSFHHWKHAVTRLQTNWHQEELCGMPALSMEYVAATRSTDLRVRLVQTRLVEINLLRVQNRTKTVHAKALAPEHRAKFDPAEAMCGRRFTYKCRLCFLRGERSFLKQLLGKPCSAASHSVVPLPASVSTPTPDEPESFFVGDTPSEILTKSIKPCRIKNYLSAQITK